MSLLGALGWGFLSSDTDDGDVLVVDVSPSCDAPSPVPPGAIRFADSRIGAALVRAAALPGARRIQLWTDAVASDPPLPPLPIDVVLLPRRDRVLCLDLRAPGRLPPGVDFAVEIDVGRTSGGPSGSRSALVRLERDGARVGPVQAVSLARGERRTLRFRDRVDRTGIVRYRAGVVEDSGDRGRDTRELALRVGDRPLALVVGSARLPDGFDVRSAGAAEIASLLAEPSMRARVDAILLEGPLPEDAAQSRIVDAVRGGTGLLILGGAATAGHPLDAILPLTDRPPGGRATLLLLDASGSMESHRDDLVLAVGRLRALFAPEDLIAFLVFRDTIVASEPWRRADDVGFDLRSIVPRGATRLQPALEAARALLARSGDANRRLLVVSDGAWKDADPSATAALLRAIEADGATAGALFVGKNPPEAALALFPNHALAGDDLAGGLFRLEEAAPDRVVAGPLPTRVAGAPSWLAPSLPAPFAARDFLRLYARGRGETIAHWADQMPIVASSEPGGRVVQVAAPIDRRNPALALAIDGMLRAVARPETQVVLRAVREGAGLSVEVRGGGEAPILLDGEPLLARPALPGVRRAVVSRVPPGPLTIACAGSLLLLPERSSAEQQGLSPDREVAASIARRSGGTLYEAAAPEKRAAGGRAVHATLLAAALFLLGAAFARSRR